MDLKEYMPLAMRTAKQMDVIDMIVHGAMGCMTESGEFADTARRYMALACMDEPHCVEELGDGMWFAVYTAQALGLDLNYFLSGAIISLPCRRLLDAAIDPLELGKLALEYCVNAEKIGTPAKAHRYYGKSLDSRLMGVALAEFVATIIKLCAVVGVSWSYVMEANVAKLKKRYPNTYSDADAVERKDKVFPALDKPEDNFASVSTTTTAYPFPTSAIDN
jgi:NTP pyrophosphatase (non-canonical NTP hydrolase)